MEIWPPRLFSESAESAVGVFLREANDLRRMTRPTQEEENTMSNPDHSRPLLLALLLAASVGAHAATPPANTSPPPDPANTGVNKRDAHDNGTPTADNQSNKQPDIRTAADVRKAIVDDKSLSVQAHNVKVLASGGVVTLRGPVNNTDEKKRIEQLAKNVPGVTSVKNELESEAKSQ